MDPLRVLIVDDEEELVYTLEERLRLRNIDAHAVTTGKDALQRILEESFDVVLLDVKMPGLGGLKVIQEIKERKPSLEVILLTGHSSEQDAEKGKRLGAYDYLMKPIKIDDLCQVIRSAAEKNICEEK
jgi:DNA-binding NtrC family response regulator